MTGTALNVVSFLFLGFFLGMRHATDADHVVAIATIVSRERSVAGSALIGAAWGVGHTITVMAVGAAIIVFGVVIPPQLGLSMEFAVGIMLVLLGVLTLTGMGRAVGAAHAHAGVPGGHALDLHDHLHAHGDYVHLLITLILSAPFAFTAVNLPKFNWRLRVASGLVSFVFGVVLIYGIGFAEGGLFTDAPTWEPR